MTTNNDKVTNNENATISDKTKEQKGLFLNIYFVSFLFLISVLDCIRRAVGHDYKIANIVFLIFCFYLIFKIILKKIKLKSEI